MAQAFESYYKGRGAVRAIGQSEYKQPPGAISGLWKKKKTQQENLESELKSYKGQESTKSLHNPLALLTYMELLI